MSVKKQHVTGFTLVELLVVIAVLAVLVSLLLPVLNKARAQAQTLQCLANLRQIGVGFTAYAMSYDGYIVPAKGAGDGRAWDNNRGFRLAMGFTPEQAKSTAAIYSQNSVCPISKNRMTGAGNPFTSMFASYGMNNEHTRRSQDPWTDEPIIKLVRVKARQRKVLVTESLDRWVDITGTNVYMNEYNPGDTDSNRWTSVAYRHGRSEDKKQQRINILFCDGHVENVSRAEGSDSTKYRWWTNP